MRLLAMLAAAILIGFTGLGRADAGVLISVDKSTQRMTVSVDGRVTHVWEVSTGRANYGTPTGVFRPQRLERTWFSAKYYNSPMPHSIFFYHGYAIHGSYEISRLGGPASHGCIRLHPQNAAVLFGLVSAHGAAATTIVVSGENPGARPALVAGARQSYPGAGSPHAARYRYLNADQFSWDGWGGARR